MSIQRYNKNISEIYYTWNKNNVTEFFWNLDEILARDCSKVVDTLEYIVKNYMKMWFTYVKFYKSLVFILHY